MLDFANTEVINAVIDDISRVNRLNGVAKRNASEAECEALTRDITALSNYRERLRHLEGSYELVERKDRGLKMAGNRFGNLVIDPVALKAGRLCAFVEGGRLALDAPADDSLYSLLTKWFVKTKRYTPQAVETFKKLVELAGLPVHGRRSKKHRLIRGGAMQYCNDPESLVERLQTGWK